MQVWNTVGWVPKYDFLENAFAVDPQTGERYLLLVSIPMPEEDAIKVPQVELRLGRFGAAIFQALRRAPARGPALQPDIGPRVTVSATVTADHRQVRLTVAVKGAPAPDGVRGWLGLHPLPASSALPSAGTARRFALSLPLPAAGEQVLVLRVTRGGTPVGYRSFLLEMTRTGAM